MKRKLFAIFIAIIAVIACAFGITACNKKESDGNNGTYYLYENSKLDKSQYIKLDGDKWSDDDSTNGTFTLSGENIVFYATVFGSNEEVYSGTLSDGALKIKFMGATMTYYKENKAPTDGNQGGTEKPDDKPKTEYTVTYDANGGAFADSKTTVTQKAKEGATLTAPASPTRTASAFSGWATDKSGKTPWKFATDTVTGNITLYAIWNEQSAAIISADGATIDEKKMTVFMLVDKNTESVSLSNKVVCSSDSVWKLYYDKLGQTEIPTKIAAGKLGELNNGDNVFYIVVTSSNGSQVNVYELTVHRSHSVAVSFYDNKGKIIDTDNAYTGYEYKVSYKPSISGYTFNYWKDSNGKKVTEITSYEPVKLYADCTVNDYKATLDVNGGNDLEKTEYTVTYDKSFTLSTPTRMGYTFTGWYYGETQVTGANGKSLANWTYDGNKTLKAGWQINKYAVTAKVDNKDAGTVEVYAWRDGKPTEDGKYEYNSKVAIEATTNSGYTFLGIYDKDGKKVNGDGKLYYVTTLGAAAESYTAKWIACPVTVVQNDYMAGSVRFDSKTIAGNEYAVTAKTNGGYTWLGWYNGEQLLTTELSYKFTMPSSVENAVTYTAKWTYYTLTTTANNKEAGTYTVKNNSKTTVGTSVTVSANTYLGYTWLGWYNGETLLTEQSSYTFDMPAENVTYNAKWSDLDERLANLIFSSTTKTCGIAGVKDKNVSEIEVPEYVTSISAGAFSGCNKLESITLPFVGGLVKTEKDTYQYPLGYIFGTKSYMNGSEIKQYYYGSSTSSTTNSTYYIPYTLKSVTITGDIILYGAFYNCVMLTSITIGNSVTSIGEYAFINCSRLTSVTIGDSVTSIGSHAFNNCSGLTNITIPDSVTTIGGSAFFGCSGLTRAIIGNGVASIGDSVFHGCSGLTSITIPDNVKSIGSCAFYNCSGLTSMTIPDSVRSIGSGAFDNCSGVIQTENGVQYVDKWVIDCNDSASSVVLRGDTKGIANCAFLRRYRLTSITISGNVKSIGDSVFHGCSGLTSITIPDSVTQIGDEAFAGCIGLTSITIGSSVTSIGGKVFNGCSGLTSITIPDSVISIGEYAFNGCSGLTSITIPDSVISIGEYAFNGCSGLTNITISDSVISIGINAFQNCSGLIQTDNGVQYVDKRIIDCITSVTSAVLRSDTKGIADCSFQNCGKLTNITIPDSVTSIGSRAFYKCYKLTSITFSGTMVQWEAIEKGDFWNYDTGNYTVHCSDGDIAKS